MSCWALVPLKARRFGKSRLAGVLDDAERASLVQSMLERVLAALADAREIDRIAVVCCEPERVPPAILSLPDSGQGLNDALAAGASRLWARGADELLVIHADLPLVRAADIDCFVRCGRSQGMALAADRHGSGTNALFVAGVTDFSFQFGAHSLSRHLAAAHARGIAPALPELDSLAFDIDTPADLACLPPAALAPTPHLRRSPTPCLITC
ncbi:2-phospho-L-lactate guanylyltransferase [Aromatoleum anaerobium]|uniref:3-phospho-D-glycerate guanylyltransferase n=1 Tax=Aromatoleum anaerobium TaxID=182180 RepID=A0ABX1PQ50_9RHOO|nr:2-phospho-L-lactate guanylyltransferase [Aromatoleum anaerobium]MCK0508091.1 2-phospho-L-lactate guanylyltransferase [Aromatoleum anaerobium]